MSKTDQGLIGLPSIIIVSVTLYYDLYNNKENATPCVWSPLSGPPVSEAELAIIKISFSLKWKNGLPGVIAQSHVMEE